MTKRKLPSARVLNRLLRYEDGKLYWRERPAWVFKNSNVRVKNSWNSAYAGAEAFTATNNCGYKFGNLMGAPRLAHRVIFCMEHGYWPDQVDHIDGNRTNNDLSNLRGVSATENAQNACRSRNNKSGVTGVAYSKSDNLWQAYIGIDGKRVPLGKHKRKEDAIAARKAGELKYGYHPNHGRAA